MKPYASTDFEQVLERYGDGQGDLKERCVTLLTDAMHWMAFNLHQIGDVLRSANDRFLLEARGNEDIEPIPTNAHRADRVEKFLLHYATDDTPEGCLTDLMADARHWCRATGRDFDQIASRAEQHFEAEIIEERGDGVYAETARHGRPRGAESGAPPVPGHPVASKLLASLESLADQADEDCPAEYRSRHFDEALHEARNVAAEAKAAGISPDSAEIDIRGLLAERRQIAAIWSVADVQQMRPGLTDDQAWEVLQEVGRRHDAEVGINWDVLKAHADTRRPAAPGPPPPSVYYTDTEGGYNYFLDDKGRLMASPFSLYELLGGGFEFDERIPVEEFVNPPLSDQERQTILAALAKQADKPASLTAAILDNPKSFLPDSGPGDDHDHGPERRR